MGDVAWGSNSRYYMAQYLKNPFGWKIYKNQFLLQTTLIFSSHNSFFLEYRKSVWDFITISCTVFVANNNNSNKFSSNMRHALVRFPIRNCWIALAKKYEGNTLHYKAFCNNVLQRNTGSNILQSGIFIYEQIKRNFIQ